MQWLLDLLTNPYLWAGISGWLLAQVLKVFIYWGVNKKFDISRLYGDGGMPSGHSATVSSLAMVTGLLQGFDSAAFAIAAILATIVCHDAMGVRRETGKQTEIITELVKAFEVFTEEKLPEVMLKEFVGHTPIQVMAGILVGILDGGLVFLIHTSALGF